MSEHNYFEKYLKYKAKYEQKLGGAKTKKARQALPNQIRACKQTSLVLSNQYPNQDLGDPRKWKSANLKFRTNVNQYQDIPNQYLVSYDSNGDGNCLFWSIDIAFSQILKEYPNGTLEIQPLGGFIQRVQATRNLLLQAAAQANPPGQVDQVQGGSSGQIISSKIYIATADYEKTIKNKKELNFKKELLYKLKFIIRIIGPKVKFCITQMEQNLMIYPRKVALS